MLSRDRVERAVRIHALGYRLLRWLEGALEKGFVAPEAAGAHAASGDAAFAWLDEHYHNLPEVARPERSELRELGNFFSTYLSSTFDLEARPGARLYSPDAHCFCPVCSWMVRRPHLRPKKVSDRDKKIAERMKRDLLLRLAASRGLPAADAAIDGMLLDPDLREPIALCTYAVDLLERLEGRANGAATLALWRSFAWTPGGSPKKRFVLSADAILGAEEILADRLAASPGRA